MYRSVSQNIEKKPYVSHNASFGSKRVIFIILYIAYNNISNETVKHAAGAMVSTRNIPIKKTDKFQQICI